MTVPRHEIVNEEEEGYYHCYTRCVRRAFLCGFDKLTGKSYEHRKQWVKDRLQFLVTIFAIDLITYAIMATHYHLLIKTRPELVAQWTAEEVARRWRILFPRRREPDGTSAEPSVDEIKEITDQPQLVATYRKRLSSISWWNRCLNEQIARMANAEDRCKGRFWEGRFRSERLDSTSAVIACSAYIDLNPIRAGVAITPEESNFTGIQQRIKGEDVKKLLPVEEFSEEGLDLKGYLTLVDESGRSLREGKAHIPEDLTPILERIGLRKEGWMAMISKKRSLFRRVIGPESAIRLAASTIGKRWLHGLQSARLVFA